MDIARNFLWPMARAGIEHPVMNRVRLRQKAEVLPYRILICALGTGPGAGFVALLRNHEQPSYSASDLAALTAAVPALKLMLAVALFFLPIVLAYTSWVFHVFRGPVTEEAIERGEDYYY